MKNNLTKEEIAESTMVIRLPNWIGDTLMTFPMLLALEKSGIDFICLGHSWTKELFSGTNIKIVVSPNVKNMKWCYNFYKTYKFQYGLICPITLSTVLPMRCAKIKTIGYHFLTNIRLKLNNDSHTVENYFDLARRFLNKNIKAIDYSNKIPINKNSIAIGKEIITKKIKSKYIVICPYATNLHKGKNKEWPYWNDFCLKYKDTKIVALVAKNDFNRCKKEFPNIVVLSENLSVSGYIMLKANFVLANDSGAMHLASFFGGKVIGLFGATEIAKTRPWYGAYKTGEKNSFITVKDLLKEI